LIELTRETADPFFGFVIFLFTRQQIPHATDVRSLEFGVGHVWMRLKMMPPQGLVKVMKNH